MKRNNVVLFILAISVTVSIALLIVIINMKNSQTTLNYNCVAMTECSPEKRLSFHKFRPEGTQITIRPEICGSDGLIEKVWCSNVKSLELGLHVSNNNAVSTTREIQTSSEKQTYYSQLNTDCGPSSRFPRDVSIIFDEPIIFDEYPWVVRLVQPDGRWYCGGTLISERHVITAAHCVTRKIPKYVEFININEQLEKLCLYLKMCNPAIKSIPIATILIHQDWDSESYANDIAIIRLAKPVQFTKYLHPICLPYKTLMPRDNSEVFAVGWENDYKLEVSLPIFPKLRCSKIYKIHFGDTQICAGGVRGKNVCKGDTGGPLMYFDPVSEKWLLTGIISLGYGLCGEEGIPSIFTFVPKYIDWILENITS